MLVKNLKYSRLLLAITVSLGGGSLIAAPNCVMPQPLPPDATESVTTDANGIKTTTVITPENAIFPAQNPFADPPGSNHLPTDYRNVCDSKGVELLNTVPSTKKRPYNLHRRPKVFLINKTSPSDDLVAAFKKIKASNGTDSAAVQRALDVLEGNPVPGRVYSGMPMLHYNGPNKKHVVKDGVVDVHQIWFDGHIESDTAFIDPSTSLDEPWKIRYTIDTLNRGHEDFAPAVMYTDDPDLTLPGMPKQANVLMDQTFFPMEDGTRTVYEIDMAQGKYYNLSYHWGWRQHPPRVQVAENAIKMVAGKNIVAWETETFGPTPTASEADKLNAIAKISDLAPAKRMWNTLRMIKSSGQASADDVAALNRAYDQWQDRNHLPDGVKADPDADWTLFYADNTIYGELKGIIDKSQTVYPDWQLRGKTVKIKLLNGDYFDHAYVNVDFGGRRGWENTFQSTQAIGGAGQWFTFGRAHWWMNVGPTQTKPTMVIVPAATGTGNNTVVGQHNVVLTLNFEPSRRLRFYQFDPFHHDVAVWSIH